MLLFYLGELLIWYHIISSEFQDINNILTAISLFKLYFTIVLMNIN